MRTQLRSTTQPKKKNHKSQAQSDALQAWHSASSEAQAVRSASSGAIAALAAKLIQGANKYGNVNSPREGKQPQICAKCEASLELTFLAIVSSITWVRINEAITRLGTHPLLFHSADGCCLAQTFVKWLHVNIGNTSLFNPEPAFGMALNMTSWTKTDTPKRERRKREATNIDVHPRARKGRSSPQ